MCLFRYDVFHSIGLGLIADHVRSNPFEQALLQPLGGLSVEALWVGLVRAERALAAEPTTLCHGDAHVQNTYSLPDGSAGLYDWQLTLRASWARDVAYLLGTALDPVVRLREEDGLLRDYLGYLRAQLALAGKPQELQVRKKEDVAGGWLAGGGCCC